MSLRLLIAASVLAFAAPVTGAGAAESPEPQRISRAQAAIPAGAIGRVGTVPITKQAYKHWVRILLAVDDSIKPTQARASTIEFLITAQWIEGEATERAISATTREIRRKFRETRDLAFRSRKSYRRFLRSSKQTQTDIMLRVRLEILSTKLRDQILKQAPDSPDPLVDSQNENKALDNFQKEFQARWRPLTFCAAPYIAPSCGYRTV